MADQEAASLAALQTEARRIREGRRVKPDHVEVLGGVKTGRQFQAVQRIAVMPVAWPAIGPPAYAIEIGLRDSGSRLTCVSFDVTAVRPGTAVDATVLRSIPVARLIREAKQRLLSQRAASAESAAGETASTVTTTHMDASGRITTTEEPADAAFIQARTDYWQGEASKARERLGQVRGEGTGRRYGPGHLQEVARIVIAARNEGMPTAAAVAEVFGCSKSAAANQIQRAKAQGYLYEEGE